MKRRVISGVLAGVLSVGMAATSIPAINVLADNSDMYWLEENGAKYWYENGVKQGTEGRGKEIFDPSSNAWYWLDAVDGGKMAVSKDVYQDSFAGKWGEREDENGDRFGKWVRYDADGHMVKGWDEKDGNKYYFDPECGTMAKGDVVIDGEAYHFNEITGVLESGTLKDDDGSSLSVDGWHRIGGVNYWYESGVRQGYRVKDDGSIDDTYRGKEIYDPSTDAWYWLDNVQEGAVAKDKDVYQESDDGHGNIGKWVRYDSEGRMVKGWDEKDGNKYYFDPVYGTMAKGYAKIDGKFYEFDSVTGVLLGEIDSEGKYEWKNTVDADYTADGRLSSKTLYTYDAIGRLTGKTVIVGKHYDSVNNIPYAVDENDTYASEVLTRVFGENGDLEQENTVVTTYDEEKGVTYVLYNEEDNYIGDVLDEKIVTVYENGEASYKTVDRYDENGNNVGYYVYGKGADLEKYNLYEYNSDNNEVKNTEYDAEGNVISVETNVYDNGNNVKTEVTDGDGKLKERTVREFDGGKMVKESFYDAYEQLTDYTEYKYDGENVEEVEYVVSNGTASKVLRKTVEKNENGDTVVTSYIYDAENGKEYIDDRMSTTYYHFNRFSMEYTAEKEFNCETTVWNDANKTYDVVYSYGYENSFNDDGVLTGYKKYTHNDKNEKVVEYSEVYDIDFSLPDAAADSDDYSILYMTRYNADGEAILNNVLDYESMISLGE